ncbi:uncharacterized protein TRIADDRAFT_62474 [Trichoplax adhaerens]|uniref:Uncharacterized protein n=1 Tax=Trichoplax adhaerens TaxID=10228 RepID=B3SDX0_TRIAD|nr:predicted protein [Trichoplax adhaerens]EDV19075.1 predicted protein [Trichoplax adhaerens]|eukprot:XP_002118439.1 predicted protein [Trichoplax adhaerens]
MRMFPEAESKLLEQVLTRFEEESGGHLMVATLCFLECSRHGLLERELLELLGEDETLRPPSEKEFTEKGPDAAQEISKRENSDKDTALANDLSKKLHVTVEETYRKTDFDKKFDDEFDIDGLLMIHFLHLK